MRNYYPKFSIVTPSYNAAKFIEDAIQSVLMQDYPNFEHIVVDGGSTDGTIEILKKYPHLKWISEPDKGQSDALNKGFKMATGEIIGWLNADEYYFDKTFEIIVRAFDENQKHDIIYGNVVLVDVTKNIIRTKYELDFDFNMLLYYGCYISTAATFYRKKIFFDNNYLDLSFHYTMDYEFYVRLAKKGYKFKHINENLAAFIVGDENKSNDIKKRTAERHRVQQAYAYKNQKINNFFAQIFHLKHMMLKILKLRIDTKNSRDLK